MKNDFPTEGAPDIFYPSYLRASGISGQAVLAYSLNDAGTPIRVEVIRSDGDGITRAAAWALSRIRFEVPPDWKATPGRERRFLMDVQYVFAGDPVPRMLDSRAEVLTITAERIRAARP